MVTVLSETKEFYPAIHEVNVLAFGRESEARLVERLRESTDFIQELSLVALKEGRVVGHILFSPVSIETEAGTFPALALAPMAVHPGYQNQGIGSQLVRQELDHCRKLGHKVVILVGHPEYYPRFGFILAKSKRLVAPFPVPDEAFMVIELERGALDGIAGMVKYPAEFDGV